jgi:Holliday junction resolvasome RuvABC ATP-dependent DNA helicase subunit
VKRPPKIPDYNYLITEEDIIEILTALSNNDIEFVIDFLEDLEPIEEENLTYTLEQVLANAGIVTANQ